MINMKRITDFALAIIATAFLGLVLTFDIGRGVNSASVALAGTTETHDGTRQFPVGGSPLSIHLGEMFLVGNVVGAGVFTIGSVVLAIFPEQAFPISRPILTRVLIYVGLIGLAVFALFALDDLLIGIAPFLSVLFSAGTVAPHVVAYLFAVAVAVSLSANITFAGKPILPIFGSTKILIGRGLGRVAEVAMLGRLWGIIEGHQKVPFLVSNPGALARRCPVFLLGATRVIVAQKGHLCQIT